MPFLAVSLILALITAILIITEVGYRWGQRRWRRVPDKLRIVSPTLEASIFGLMGLLVAFTFYGAGARFDARRSLIAQEANAIGTAYLRLDLVPPSAQPQLREDFRQYVRSRLAVFQQTRSLRGLHAALDHSSSVQRKVWDEGIEAIKDSGPAEKSLFIASLNQMIDITTVQTVALMTHPPMAIFGLLGLMVVICSALAGYTMSASGTRDWILSAVFAFVLGVAVYIVLDYEYPRFGIVRVDPVDQILIQTLEKMD